MPFTKFSLRNFIPLLVMFLFSCSSAEKIRPENPNPPVVHHYYYAPPQQQQQPVPYPPVSPYGQQVPPGSRYYSNPYDIPAYGNYNGATYYDSDQYYRPPTQYQNVERPVQFINNGSMPF